MHSSIVKFIFFLAGQRGREGGVGTPRGWQLAGLSGEMKLVIRLGKGVVVMDVDGQRDGGDGMNGVCGSGGLGCAPGVLRGKALLTRLRPCSIQAQHSKRNS